MMLGVRVATGLDVLCAEQLDLLRLRLLGPALDLSEDLRQLPVITVEDLLRMAWQRLLAHRPASWAAPSAVLIWPV